MLLHWAAERRSSAIDSYSQQSEVPRKAVRPRMDPVTCFINRTFFSSSFAPVWKFLFRRKGKKLKCQTRAKLSHLRKDMQICWRAFSRRVWNNFWEPTLILNRTSNLPAWRPGAYANCSLPFVNCFGPSCFVAWRGLLLQNTPSCSCVNLCSVSISITLCDSVLPLLRQGNAFIKLQHSLLLFISMK